MKSNLYVIRDKVAEECGPIFQAPNDGVAVRAYRNLTSDANPKEDYELLFVGTIDSCVGEVYSTGVQVSIPVPEIKGEV